MNGGPSQVDLFDPKPTLNKFAGSAPSRDIVNEIEFANEVGSLLPSSFKYSKHGKSGIEVSELMPYLADCVDDITLIRSMYGEHFNHEPALYLMHSGRTLPGRPSLGSWVIYGLGSENQNLPAYIVLDDPKGLPINSIQNWQSGWLPPVYQGTRFRSEGLPLLNLKPREELPAPLVEAQRALLQRMDQSHRQKHPGQPDLVALTLHVQCVGAADVGDPHAGRHRGDQARPPGESPAGRDDQVNAGPPAEHQPTALGDQHLLP